MKRLLFILLFLPLLSTGQTTFIVNSYQVQAAGGGGYDADATTYLNAITTSGTSVAGKETAFDNFYTGAKSDGFYSKIIDAGFNAWGASAANAVHMKSVTTSTFFGSPTHGANGIAYTSGSTQYQTVAKAPNLASQNGLGFGVYNQTTPGTSGAYMMGSNNGTGNDNRIGRALSTSIKSAANSSSTQSADGTVAGASSMIGFLFVNRTSSSSVSLSKNGTTLATNASSTSVAPTSNAFFVGAINNSGGASAYYTGTISFWVITDGMSATDVANLNTRVEALHDALGIGVQ